MAFDGSSGPALSVATESDANLGANSAKLFLRGPFAQINHFVL